MLQAANGGCAPARRDRRRLGALLTLAVVFGGGALLQALAPLHPAEPLVAPPRDELRERFEQAVLMLHAKQYEHAVTALHRVLELAPRLPEAHVNMGFALLGLGRAAAARDFFEAATALRPEQANAYYGLALAHEAEGDTELAIGAMRSYLHRARDADAAHLRRARAALWEWEAARRPFPQSGTDSRDREARGPR
ncbi:MAG: tetratricopeptide repeat protein [Piscinibacter sp.]|nr:tetratricopeptide repeat protein [Piscinibacter sp.]